MDSPSVPGTISNGNAAPSRASSSRRVSVSSSCPGSWWNGHQAADAGGGGERERVGQRAVPPPDVVEVLAGAVLSVVDEHVGVFGEGKPGDPIGRGGHRPEAQRRLVIGEICQRGAVGRDAVPDGGTRVADQRGTDAERSDPELLEGHVVEDEATRKLPEPHREQRRRQVAGEPLPQSLRRRRRAPAGEPRGPARRRDRRSRAPGCGPCGGGSAGRRLDRSPRAARRRGGGYPCPRRGRARSRRRPAPRRRTCCRRTGPSPARPRPRTRECPRA